MYDYYLPHKKSICLKAKLAKKHKFLHFKVLLMESPCMLGA